MPVTDNAKAIVELTAPVELTKVPGGVPDIDEDAKAAVAYAPTLRLRWQFQLYDARDRQYKFWTATQFGLVFARLDLLVQFRKDLEAFVREWVRGHAKGDGQ